jgi:hypothetical protein
MKYLSLFLTATLTLTTSLVMAETTLMDTPNASASLRFGDQYASAFYTVDGDHFNVIVAFSAGPEEDAQLVRQVFQLKDGQSYRVSIGGYGDNQQATTIKMKRERDHILADVVTCDSRAKIANCI